MITKHVPMKTVKKSDFAGLVKYLTDEQGKQERVLLRAVTNCHSDDPLVAAIEVENTQAQNKRAVSDKTYHLIISFPAGESPTSEVLKAIEVRLCEGLGFGVHQRVSAVHHDTDNLHIHVAINKIHPKRYTLHEPYNDYWMRDQLCDKLEREFGLQADNHQAQKSRGENRAADMERHAGVESLLGWTQRECLAEIRLAKSWHELHQVLQDNGLELRLHGNGLVFTDGAGTAVKASSVARDLSKSQLEAKLGAFEPSAAQRGAAATRPARRYEPRPVRSRINTAELYARYQAEQRDSNAARAADWGKLRAAKDRLIAAAKRSGRLRRAAIKLMGGDRLGRHLLYAAVAKTLKNGIQKISRAHQKQRQAATERHRREAWADWLRSQATAGDAEALAALRAREAAVGLKGNTIRAHGGSTAAQRGAAAVDATQDGVTKKGTVIYRVGESAIRDDGDRLNVSRGATQQGLEAALRLARERYGDRITVNGSDDFREQIAHAAAASRLPITFDDEALECRRQSLITTTQEKNYDNAHRGRADYPGAGRTGFAGGTSAIVVAQPSARAFGEAGAGRFATAERSAGRKPDLARVGRRPPPASQNRLRGLSQLGVVRIASGSEVLLPRDVPHHLEQQGAADLDGVRRGVSWPRGIDAAAAQAADKYIAERESKRCNRVNISNHVRYTDQSSGAITYAGTRQIEDQSLALLKRDDEVMVLPVDETTARRLKRLAVGELVTVTPKGTITTKGRGR
jgi:hypothetical protein